MARARAVGERAAHKGRTYKLLITQHRPGATNDGKRPPPETRLLFRGIHVARIWICRKDKNKAGTALPTFYSRAGEEVRIPKRFRAVVRAITNPVHCDGCFHGHYVRPPKRVEEQVCSGIVSHNDIAERKE